MANTNQSPISNNREPVAFDDRTRRVMELRRQIREGTYRPAAEEVAAALLRDWSALSDVTHEFALPPIDANPDTSSFAGRFVVAGTSADLVSPAVMTA